MLRLALCNLVRRRTRTALTVIGLALSVALFSGLLACGTGYERGLGRELDAMGMQLMVVPLGCPYDAAARVLKGHALDVSFPERSLQTVRLDPDVAVAAPVFSAERPVPAEGRTDLWVGIDRTTMVLKPWLKLTPGSRWFTEPNSVVLGADAAEAELRHPSDSFLSPETGTVLRVSGTLERSGTSDDSLFFLPLKTAQRLFGGTGKLTAIAVRLKDPNNLERATDRLQKIPGAQVVTMTEMLGTFLNLTGAARTLITAIGLIALAISALGIFNTMTSSVLQRTSELGVMRAIGFGRPALFTLMVIESVVLSTIGGASGILISVLSSRGVELAVRPFLPLAPQNGLFFWTAENFAVCMGISFGVGVVAGLFPAWQASRLHPAVALRAEG